MRDQVTAPGEDRMRVCAVCYRRVCGRCVRSRGAVCLHGARPLGWRCCCWC